MWNPAHRRTPNHGAAVRGTALLSLFSQSILKLPPSALLKDLGRGIGEETGKPGAEGIEPQTQVVRVSEAVSPFLIEGNQVVHRELIQITDEGGRGMPGLRFHIDEAAWALMEELLDFGGDLIVMSAFAAAFLWGAKWSHERIPIGTA